LFKGLPRDPALPDTPSENGFPPLNKNTFVSEFVLSMFAKRLGEPYNFIQEEQGNIFRNIRPIKKNESEQSSDCSKINLELHVEIAFHTFKPDYLLLSCLRGDRDQNAYTLISSLNKIGDVVDESLKEELKKPQFKFRAIDYSFGGAAEEFYCNRIIPVLDGEGDEMTITYDLDLMRGVNGIAQAALDQLKSRIESVQEKIMLEPGDLLVIDNKRAIHGRTAFTPYFDGHDRWLQRVLVTANPDFTSKIPSEGRVIK